MRLKHSPYWEHYPTTMLYDFMLFVQCGSVSWVTSFSWAHTRRYFDNMVPRNAAHHPSLVHFPTRRHKKLGSVKQPALRLNLPRKEPSFVSWDVKTLQILSSHTKTLASFSRPFILFLNSKIVNHCWSPSAPHFVVSWHANMFCFIVRSWLRSNLQVVVSFRAGDTWSTVSWYLLLAISRCVLSWWSSFSVKEVDFFIFDA